MLILIRKQYTDGTSNIVYPINHVCQFVVLSFVVVIRDIFYPYTSGLLLWYYDKYTIVPVPIM